MKIKLESRTWLSNKNPQFSLKYSSPFLLIIVVFIVSSCSKPKEELFALYNPSDPNYSVSVSHTFVSRSKEKGDYFTKDGQHVPNFSKFVDSDIAEGALKVYCLYKEKDGERLYRVWKTLTNENMYETGFVIGGADLFSVFNNGKHRILKLKFELPESGNSLGVYKVNKSFLVKVGDQYSIELNITNSSLDVGSVTNSFYLVHNDIIISKVELAPSSTLHFNGEEQKSVIFFTNENLDYITNHITDGLELVNTMQNWIVKL